MALRKVIQDSDGDEDVGSASNTPMKAIDASDSAIIHPGVSPPAQALPQSADPSTGSTGKPPACSSLSTSELLTREIHNAQQSLTEPSPEDRNPISTTDTNTRRFSTSPVISRNKRRKTTMGITDDTLELSKLGRLKSFKVYGSKSSSQKDFDFHSSDDKIEHRSKERNKPVRDEWEFPSSSASNDPLAPRREAGSTRVKSRNAGGDTILVTSSPMSGRDRSRSVLEPPESHTFRVGAFEGNDGASIQLDNPQPAGKSTQQKRPRRRKTIHDDIALHREGPSSSLELGKVVDSTDDSGIGAQTSFQIGLTDPALALAASQREQYGPISATTSITGSLPPPLGDEPVFVDPYVKFSDESSTVLNTTPLKELRNAETDGEITKTFSESNRASAISICSIPSQSPREASQTGWERSRTPRRSKTSLGLQSPRNDSVTSSATTGTHTSVPIVKPKRRSKTTMSTIPQQTADEVSLDDHSLPASVFEATTSRAHKSKNKRKADDDDDDKHADELGSDDVAVGLPKDQYKPRPSRSRGNPVADHILEKVDFSKRPEAQAKAKNKRRKTNDSEVANVLEEEAPIQAVRGGENGTTEHYVDTKQPAAVLLEKDAILNEDIAKEVEVETQPAKRGPRSKRKIIVDEGSDGDADNDKVHAQEEQGLAEKQTKPETKKPAPKGRGRPRKKTQEKTISVSEEKVMEGNDFEERAADEVMLLKPPKDGQNVLNDRDVNSTISADHTYTTNLTNSHTTPEVQTTPPPTQKPTTPIQTPQKGPQKGPDKHSPLNNGKVPYRVGLSKRARIEPLLRIVKK
ncbi:MAG: hypothetical protein M1830_000793 [Pleopsidium flavum]|nr:MAG: hypothetical protein M1830_000793 [Pleopsidium flavum]